MRFELSYVFLFINYGIRVFFNFFTDEGGMGVPSLSQLFLSSNWLEREVWDMFGIFFINHPNLCRILTDYGFEAFPLRKDFPVIGYEELRYDEELKTIVFEPVEFSQEIRFFEFSGPWLLKKIWRTAVSTTMIEPPIPWNILIILAIIVIMTRY